MAAKKTKAGKAERAERFSKDVSCVPDDIRTLVDALEEAIDSDDKEGMRSAANGINELVEAIYAVTR